MNLRSLSITAGLALATTLLAPVPAQAAAVTAATNYASRQVNEIGPATCNATNSGSNSSGAYTSNGVPVTHSVTGTTTLVDAGDAGDTSSIVTTASSRIKATESGGSMRSVDLDGTFSASFTIAQGIGTDCDAQAQLSAQALHTGVLAQPKWVLLDADIPSGGTAQVIFQRTVPSAPSVISVIAMVGNAKGHAHAEVYLPAGTYQQTTVITAAWQGPSVANDPTSFAAKPFLHILFEPVGIAKADASGDGGKYLKLKNSRKCATNQLTGKFKSAAGVAATAKIKKAIFKVNGTKSKVVNLPEKNDKVTLTNLPSADDISVKAILKLFGGGSTTLTRDYRSCT